MNTNNLPIEQSLLLITTRLIPNTGLSPHQHTGIMSTYGITMDNIISSMPEYMISPL